MIKFLTLYKQQKCLWDTSLNEYKMKSARSKALKTIVNEMDISYFNVAECKIKIKNIRSHYCQELKKIRESKNEDQAYVYTPSLSWFQTVDSFLKDFVHRNATSLNNNAKVSLGKWGRLNYFPLIVSMHVTIYHLRSVPTII